jgi:hypothetical protein
MKISLLLTIADFCVSSVLSRARGLDLQLDRMHSLIVLLLFPWYVCHRINGTDGRTSSLPTKEG